MNFPVGVKRGNACTGMVVGSQRTAWASISVLLNLCSFPRLFGRLQETFCVRERDALTVLGEFTSSQGAEMPSVAWIERHLWTEFRRNSWSAAGSPLMGPLFLPHLPLPPKPQDSPSSICLVPSCIPTGSPLCCWFDSSGVCLPCDMLGAERSSCASPWAAAGLC